MLSWLSDTTKQSSGIVSPTTVVVSGWSGNYFHVFSSTDLVNWSDEGVILDVN